MFCPILTLFQRMIYATMVRPEMRLNNQVGQIQANVDRAEVKLERQECWKEECAMWDYADNIKDGWCGLKHP
jgi:hypothetical protein